MALTHFVDFVLGPGKAYGSSGHRARIVEGQAEIMGVERLFLKQPIGEYNVPQVSSWFTTWVADLGCPFG